MSVQLQVVAEERRQQQELMDRMMRTWSDQQDD
jgi:polyhydroxyalkanoate synthesis regulator protein